MLAISLLSTERQSAGKDKADCRQVNNCIFGGEPVFTQLIDLEPKLRCLSHGLTCKAMMNYRFHRLIPIKTTIFLIVAYTKLCFSFLVWSLKWKVGSKWVIYFLLLLVETYRPSPLIIFSGVRRYNTVISLGELWKTCHKINYENVISQSSLF